MVTTLGLLGLRHEPRKKILSSAFSPEEEGLQNETVIWDMNFVVLF